MTITAKLSKLLWGGFPDEQLPSGWAVGYGATDLIGYVVSVFGGTSILHALEIALREC